MVAESHGDAGRQREEDLVSQAVLDSTSVDGFDAGACVEHLRASGVQFAADISGVACPREAEEALLNGLTKPEVPTVDAGVATLSVSMLGRVVSITTSVPIAAVHLKSKLVAEAGLEMWPSLSHRGVPVIADSMISTDVECSLTSIPASVFQEACQRTIIDQLWFVEQQPEEIRIALCNDQEFMRLVLPRAGDALEIAGSVVKDDRDLVLCAVRSSGGALRFASNRLCDDKEVVMHAVQGAAVALQFASERLRDDDDVVLSALKSGGQALAFASARFQDDREVVASALSTAPRALRFASSRLRDHTQLVRYAVYRDGIALRFASDRLRDDTDVVRTAVAQCGAALEFASDRLRDTNEVAAIAASETPWAADYASERVQRYLLSINLRADDAFVYN
mmetsp:Transcript_70646/g.188340  ORF Transcript_70646/g.188340 Transcript_70646/m.188340 type:complete len:395 (-) Transcript_70646:67-1251(-)